MASNGPSHGGEAGVRSDGAPGNRRQQMQLRRHPDLALGGDGDRPIMEWGKKWWCGQVKCGNANDWNRRQCVACGVAWWKSTGQPGERTDVSEGTGQIPAWRNPSTDGAKKRKKNKKKHKKKQANDQQQPAPAGGNNPRGDGGTAGGPSSIKPSVSLAATPAAARGDSQQGAQRAQNEGTRASPGLGAEVDLEALRTHLSTLKVVVGDNDPDVRSLAARIHAEERRRAEETQASEAEARSRAERKAKPPSVVKAQNKHRSLVVKRDKAQERVAQRRKAVESAQSELATALDTLVGLEERVLLAEADVRTAMHQLEAELDGREGVPEIQVVTSTLETQMATLLRTVAQTAQAMLSGTGADILAMRQQMATWVEQIALLPLLPKVKDEPEDDIHPDPADESDQTKRPEGSPPLKLRRKLKEGRSATSAEDDPGFNSASSAVEVLSDMDDPQAKDVPKGNNDKGKPAGSGRDRPGRSRSPH
jgi:hypothetical protein